MEADRATSHVEFFRQSLYSDFGSKGTGRYRACKNWKRFTVAFPKCILLWACTKMQLFFCVGIV